MKRSPRKATLLILALTIQACGFGPSSNTTVPSRFEDQEFDLSDPELQILLGVPEPTVDWSRRAGRVDFVGAGSPASPTEVDLLASVVAEVPAALDKVAAPRWVVRASSPPANSTTHPQAVAFAFGPDIYLLDGSFELSRNGSTRFDLARAYIHELAHVAQYRTLSDDYVQAALDGRLERVDPIGGSTLIEDFARQTGWVNQASGELIPTWALSTGATTATAYGASNPGEDMAESLALVMLGLSELVPDDRVTWIERWLGETATELALGRPWAPAGSSIATSAEELWDAREVALLSIGFDQVEPLYFELPSGGPTGAEMADTVTAKLRERLMAGQLTAIDDPRVPRYGGRFLRQDGSFFWVELWDFPEANQGRGIPAQPILVYVAIW
ncbi:MAG TPA: DUF4157 domain-containing protein [Actinobacteria bacterium]|nr:DUF4157 domain-containing protein [Actinomycetota bacterium]